MLLKCLLLCAVQFISHICLAGNTLYVNPDGKENAAGTADDPCKTLVEVMKKVTPNNGDIVYAAPGVYDNGEAVVDGIKYRVSIPAGTKLISTGTRENTFLVGKADTTANAVNGCGPDAVRCGYLAAGAEIHGFTITGGRDSTMVKGSAVSPGGLLGVQKSACFAYNCIFSNNVTMCRGAALGNATPVGCYFANNRAEEGNGDAFQMCDAYNCVFGPTANYHGYYQCKFYNCTFFHKTARTSCEIYNSLILVKDNFNVAYPNKYYNFNGNLFTVFKLAFPYAIGSIALKLEQIAAIDTNSLYFQRRFIIAGNPCLKSSCRNRRGNSLQSFQIKSGDIGNSHPCLILNGSDIYVFPIHAGISQIVDIRSVR